MVFRKMNNNIVTNRYVCGKAFDRVSYVLLLVFCMEIYLGLFCPQSFLVKSYVKIFAGDTKIYNV